MERAQREKQKESSKFRLLDSIYKENTVSVATDTEPTVNTGEDSELGRKGAGWDWDEQYIRFNLPLFLSKNEQKCHVREPVEPASITGAMAPRGPGSRKGSIIYNNENLIC